MKLVQVLLLTLCLLALCPQLALAQESNNAGRIRRNEGAVAGSYIVVFKDSVPQGRVEAFAAQLAREHGGMIGFTYQHALRGFSVEMNEAQAVALSHNPQVEYIEEDALVEGASVQNSPQWALDRIDQRTLPLNNSYSYANSGAGVNVYVIDGGIRMTHQEFGGRAALAYDYLAGGTGTDCNGHGTHVAGLIGGKTYGVAKDAKLWAVRVLDCANQGLVSRVIAGIDWVAANHVKPAVANLSFFTGNANDTLDLAVRNLIAAGVTSVVAAGNLNRDASLHSPARVAEAITVAATDIDDNRASLSNYGSVVDVFAPGVQIVSAHSLDDTSTFTRTGTSSAAPFVAGMAARYLSANPTESPAAVSRAITSNATPDRVINAGLGSPNLLLFRPSSKIAFSSMRDGNWELYVMDSDGSNQKNITLNASKDLPVVWSPDGRKIAFQSNRTGAGDIYVMNSDGSGLTRLTTSTYADQAPTWSPDSQKIAFISKRDGNFDVFVMNADGTNQVNVTRSVSPEYDPIWSPTENKIAFRSYRDGLTKYYVMNADGTNQIRLTGARVDENYLKWSPDGRKVTYASYFYTPSYEEHYDVWVVNIDGSSANALPITPYYGGGDFEPAWSPDGKTLALGSTRYTGSPYGLTEIYTINPDGSNPVRLTFSSMGNVAVEWSPGSDRLVFMQDSGPNYSYEIFTMNADGSNQVKLTTNAVDNTEPTWQPM
ncbi:MAG TPA: S8 family serine peptidase [Pyrinomonadaceae bacterium]|nr:S8 family serine peptidase [Pyrinomonadaceae bacterium]